MTRSGLIYLIGAGIQGLAVLLVTPFITRTLGPTEYGKVSVVIVTVQMIATVLSAGFPQLILRDYNHGEEGKLGARVFVGILMLFGACVAIPGTVVIYLCSALGWISDPIVPAAIVIGAGGLVCVIAGQSLFRAQERPFAFLALAVGSTLGALLVGAAVSFQARTAQTFLVGYVLVLIVLSFLCWPMVRPLWPWKHRAAARAGLRVGAALMPHGLAMLVLLSGDVLLAKIALGPAASGTYQPALTLGNVTFAAATAFYNAWGPAIYKHDPEHRWSWMGRSAGLLATGLAACAACVVMSAPISVALLVGPNFDRQLISQLLAMLAWTAVPYVFYLGSSIVLIEHGRTKLLAATSSTVAVIFVGVGLGLTNAFGLQGLALTKIACYVLLACAVGIIAGRMVTVQYSKVSMVVLAVVAVICIIVGVGWPSALATTIALGVGAVVLAVLAWRQLPVLKEPTLEQT